MWADLGRFHAISLFSIVSATYHRFTGFYLPITSLDQLFILFRLVRVSTLSDYGY
jgi:hypothetical protein